MPIYEYECRGCGHRLEAIQRFSDPLLTDCPACGKAELRKLLSPAGFQLKGTGWYVTDFRDGSKPKEKKEDRGKETAGGESGTSSSGKSETKSESKSENKKGKKAATGSDD